MGMDLLLLILQNVDFFIGILFMNNDLIQLLILLKGCDSVLMFFKNVEGWLYFEMILIVMLLMNVGLCDELVKF